MYNLNLCFQVMGPLEDPGVHNIVTPKFCLHMYALIFKDLCWSDTSRHKARIYNITTYACWIIIVIMICWLVIQPRFNLRSKWYSMKVMCCIDVLATILFSLIITRLSIEHNIKVDIVISRSVGFEWCTLSIWLESGAHEEKERISPHIYSSNIKK